MKLRNTNRIALRALAIAATVVAAQAAVITVTTSPYTYSTPGTNADTIQANAGGALITVSAASSLTGNAANSPAISLNVSGYTVTNLGTLVGNTAAGITVGAAAANSTIINSGNISGTTGITFGGTTSVDTLTMTAGTLTGTTSAVTFGAGVDTLNLRGGTITGNVDGGVGIDVANFDGGTATLTGNLSTFETIVRNGTGVATINGVTTADSITVSAGSLYLNGNVNPSTLAEATVTLNLGELGGTGIWDAALAQSGGLLSAGATPLSIGNLTLGADALGTKLNVTGGYLLVHMNPSALTSDLITASSSASISGGAGILVSPTSLDAPLQSTSTRVLDVTGTRTGNYAAATFFLEAGRSDVGPLQATTGSGAFTSATVSLLVGDSALDADDTDVSVVHHYDTVAGLSNFGEQFGGSLNGRVADSLTDPVLADFLGYLDYSSAATVADVMNSYEPTVLQTSQAYSVVSAREIHRIVEQQNAGDRMFPTSTHVWGNFNYNDYSDIGNSTRYTLGVGTAIDTFHFGALVSYADSDITDNASVESLSYGAYFAMGETTGWQWNGYIGGSQADTSSNPIPGVSFDPDGDGFQALLSGAYMMELGACTWGPTFGVEYTSAKLDGSIKPGANLPSMGFDADTLESLRSLLGVRAEFNFDSKIRPYLSAQWAHEFDGESNGYTATFQGGSFNVYSPLALSEDAIILRAGVVVGFGESWFGDVGYLGELSTNSDGVDYNGLNVGLRASF